MTFDYRKEYNRDPDANALFHFELDGIRFLHMRDTDIPLLEDHLKELDGNVDVLLAHADAHAKIALDELYKVITRLKPKPVIPMHYDGAKGY